MGLNDEITQNSEPDADTSASTAFTKPKMGQTVLADCTEKMRLTDILEEHPLARDLEREIGTPFFAAPPHELVPAAWVMALLERMPLIVREDYGEGTTCVGNIRLYRLARIALSGDEMVSVRRDTGSLTAQRKRKLREGLLAEAFLLPAVFGRRAEEIRALELAWARISQPEQIEMDIAGLYRSGVARPKQRRKREQKASR